MLSGKFYMQRAACDAYGIIVNVLTSDQHNWCVSPHACDACAELQAHECPRGHNKLLTVTTQCSGCQESVMSF